MQNVMKREQHVQGLSLTVCQNKCINGSFLRGEVRWACRLRAPATVLRLVKDFTSKELGLGYRTSRIIGNKE